MTKVASIQLSSGPNVQANLLEVGKYLDQISKTSSKLVVLPENFALMPEDDSEFLTHGETVGSGPRNTCNTISIHGANWKSPLGNFS